MENFNLRPYQSEAVSAGLEIISFKKPGLIVLPTGTGKSLVIADIVRQSGLKTIVLQPTKEILEQNLSKIKASGLTDIGIFSASMNQKKIGKITIATIGTIINRVELFSEFELIICDEAHLINSKGGQYEEFISSLNLPVIGLTATPFRMKYYQDSFKTGEFVTESRFLTRTRPRIFNKINYIAQIPDMFEQGFLCPVLYECDNLYDSSKIRSNSTGQGYDETSLLSYNKSENVIDEIISKVSSINSKHILIFTHFTEESKSVIYGLFLNGISCAEVSGKTPKKEREIILSKFKSGEIRCVVNVGVLTVGFDFPELDCIVIGRPIKSLALFYQICGRGLRPFLGKAHCKIIDICDNVKRFGEINTFEFLDYSGTGLWRLKSNSGYLTGVNLNTGEDLEKKQMEEVKDKKEAETGELVLSFGKHKGKKISELDSGYLEWAVKTFDAGKWKTIFKNEIKSRSTSAGARA